MATKNYSNATDLKLNLGCGDDIREGFVNVDFSDACNPDLVCDFTRDPIPLPDDSVAYIYASHVMEHIPHERFITVLDELARVCQNGAILEIYCPHMSGPFAGGPHHYTLWNSFMFTTFEHDADLFSGEHYGTFRCRTLDRKLHFFTSNADRAGLPGKLGLRYVGGDWFWNLFGSGPKGWIWQQIWERFQPFGFNEIYFKLEIVKQQPRTES